MKPCLKPQVGSEIYIIYISEPVRGFRQGFIGEVHRKVGPGPLVHIRHAASINFAAIIKPHRVGCFLDLTEHDSHMIHIIGN